LVKCTAFNFTSIRNFRVGLLHYAVKPNWGLPSTVLLSKYEEPESMGSPVGCSPGQQKGRCSRTGPELHFRWWRGFRTIARPSGDAPDEGAGHGVCPMRPPGRLPCSMLIRTRSTRETGTLRRWQH